MHKTKNRKNDSFVVLFLLLVASAVIVTFYVSYGFDVQKSETDVEKESDANLKSEMAGWKVYYNNDFKFRIDYPGDWKAQVTKYGDFSTHSVYFGEPVNSNYPVMINFYKKPSDVSYMDWVEDNAYLSGTFKRGYIESKGLLPNYYIDKTVIGGMDAYRVLILSDTYFFPKVPEGKLYDIYHRCKCDFDRESAYILNGDTIISITSMNNMNGKNTSNKFLEINQRYEVESSDKSYIESKEIFSKMISSFRFMEK